MKLSIIIPIYNTARYLKKCIESALSQTYKNLEIILIDDGSTDGSSSICDYFAQLDHRVKVIHRENAGLVNARKQGIEVAQGEYIGFLDSDDWIESDMYETMMKEAILHQIDIVIEGYIYEGSETRHGRNPLKSGIYNKKEMEIKIYPYMLYNGVDYEFGLTQYMWNKIFKKEIIQAGIEGMDNRITDGEDVGIFFPTMLRANKISILDECKYHYRDVAASMSRIKKDNYFENALWLKEHLTKEFKESSYNDIMRPQLKRFMGMFLCNGLRELFGVEKRRNYIYDMYYPEILSEDKIVLYGAGKIGKVYYKQIRELKQFKLVAWVDKKLAGQPIYNGEIQAQEYLKNNEYDKVILAISNEETAKEIMNELVQIGVPEQKIIWKKPVRVWGNVGLS